MSETSCMQLAEGKKGPVIARQIEVKENSSQLQIWYYFEFTAMNIKNSPLYGNKEWTTLWK